MRAGEISPCLSDGQLEELIDEIGSEATRELAAEHLDACARCQRRLDELAGGSALLPRGELRRVDCVQSTGLQRAMNCLAEWSPSTLPSTALPPHADALLAPPIQPGTIGRFGGLDIVEQIASGGMGMVFKGHDPVLNRMVAVKFLAPSLSNSELARSRFLREARAAAAVVHENVVAIHTFGEENGVPFLVMHFVQGSSLETRLRNGPLELEQILRIGVQTALGLAAAHRRGLIHRDVKPGNILLEEPGERVKLTDFGLARAVDEPGLTRPGSLAGTPEYMSPEQARGEGIDGRSDLFSLGAVLYTLTARRSPFLADSTLATLQKVTEFAPPTPHEINPQVPVWLSDTILRLLAKDRCERFQSANEVATLLGNQLAALDSRSAQRSGTADDPQPARQWPGCRRNRLRTFLSRVALLLFCLNGPAVRDASWRDSVSAPFLVWRSQGTLAGRFASFRKAIACAQHGDIIEVSGGGSVLCEPVRIRGKTLRIRAACEGGPALINNHSLTPLIFTDAPLTVEGLELRALGADSDVVPFVSPGRSSLGSLVSVASSPSNPPDSWPALVVSEGAPVEMNYCRLVGPLLSTPGQALLRGVNVPSLTLHNCDLYLGSGAVVVWTRSEGGPLLQRASLLRLDNCIVMGRESIHLRSEGLTRIECQRTTFVGAELFTGAGTGPVQVDARESVFDVNQILRRRSAEGWFPIDRNWNGLSNLYSLGRSPRNGGPRFRSNDNEFLRNMVKADLGSVLGNAGLRARLAAETGPKRKRSPNEFRLVVDAVAPTMEAPVDCLKPMGAAVERVGPGAPYEAWRQSLVSAAEPVSCKTRKWSVR